MLNTSIVRNTNTTGEQCSFDGSYHRSRWSLMTMVACFSGSFRYRSLGFKYKYSFTSKSTCTCTYDKYKYLYLYFNKSTCTIGSKYKYPVSSTSISTCTCSTCTRPTSVSVTYHLKVDDALVDQFIMQKYTWIMYELYNEWYFSIE